MKIRILILALSAFFLIYACESKKESSGKSVNDYDLAIGYESNAPNQTVPPSESYMMKAEAEPTDRSVVSEDNVVIKKTTDKKKIIKDGSMNIQTANIDKGKKSLDELLKKYNAYYESEELKNEQTRVSYILKIRIPSELFEQLMAALENQGDEVTSKSINVRDVTEEYQDIEARLANKREYLIRYKEILHKASTIKDILEVEENIRVLQEEIESKEGRLKYLNDQISLSTLDIFLYKDKDYVHKEDKNVNFTERLKTSLSEGWSSVVSFVLWVIANWPVLILIIFLSFVARRYIKKWMSKRKELDE
jgi:hypothetical protein